MSNTVYSSSQKHKLDKYKTKSFARLVSYFIQIAKGGDNFIYFSFGERGISLKTAPASSLIKLLYDRLCFIAFIVIYIHRGGNRVGRKYFSHLIFPIKIITL